jgi:hypothetical protein
MTPRELIVSDYVADIAMSSWEGMQLNKGNHWKGKGGMGRVRGVQYTANLGQEWMGIRATTQRKDFQVSKGGISK